MSDWWQLTRWRIASAMLCKDRTVLDFYRDCLADELKAGREAVIQTRDSNKGFKQIAVFVKVDDDLHAALEADTTPENYFDIRNHLGGDDE